MPVQRPGQGPLIIKEVVAVKGLIPEKVISAALILLSAPLRNDIDNGTAIVAIFGRIIVAEYLDLRHGILIDGHTQLVRSAGLACIQSVNRGHRRAPAPARYKRQIGAKTAAVRFDVVLVSRTGNQTEQ